MTTNKQTNKQKAFALLLFMLCFFKGYSQQSTFQIIPPDGGGDLEEIPVLEENIPVFNFSPSEIGIYLSFTRFF